MAHAADPHATHGHEHAPATTDERLGGSPLALLLLLATTAISLWALLYPRASWNAPLPASARTTATPVAATPADATRHAATPATPAAAAPADATAAAPSTTSDAPATATTPAASADAGGLGPMVDHSLPGGARIAVPARGVEGRLLAFLQDASVPAEKGTWFDFDRLTFESGSARLQARSSDQLDAVAAILAAHPAVKLKIGGYTDSVGQPASNLRLSGERAANVRAALIQRGVSPDRLAAEGYGDQHPVGDNATPEGRAMNRRISMRVVAK
jgi:outer membrane protein OmpA-like peptidoglycan-associated protein